VASGAGGKGGSKVKSPLFEKNPRSFRIGGHIQPVRDLTRFVKWPKYIRIQRQKRILLQRLKVPPAINQFSKTIDKNQASTLFKLLVKYKPETKKDKKARLLKEAEGKANDKDKSKKKGPKPINIKFGLNHVTQLVEEGKAKLVIMAHDVDPIEMMCFLPALCRKKGIPYCFIKGKARLGKLVHQKTATCLALTEVKKEDAQDLDTQCKNFKSNFNENDQLRRHWGGGVMGIKNQHMMAIREKIREQELAKKANM